LVVGGVIRGGFGFDHSAMCFSVVNMGGATGSYQRKRNKRAGHNDEKGFACFS